MRLKDVAVVEDGLEDRRRLNRAMGESSIGFGITKMRGANAVQVGRDVKAKIEALKPQLPEGLRLDVNWDTTVFIERSIHEILFTLVLAALLTGLVCWLFLGSWSTTVNVLLAIPTSILGTFIVIYFFGFTLNTYTVLGLTLVVGIVVDDAIMVLENIYRHREMGEGKVTAASAGAREITFAAAATTLAIVAIFLPVAFMKGIIGKFFFQFGVTISVAVAALAPRGAHPGADALLAVPRGRAPRAARPDDGSSLPAARRGSTCGRSARPCATGPGCWPAASASSSCRSARSASCARSSSRART